MSKDFCNNVTLETSVSLLEQLIQNLFGQKGLARPWFPGHGEDFALPEPRQGTQEYEVVFFGNFMAQLLRAPLWPQGRFRLWALSHSSAEVIQNLLGLEVNVLSRYEMYPAPLEQKYCDLQSEWDMVYSGRLSYSKNVHLLLRLMSVLQTQFQLPVRPKFFGSFDQVGKEDLGQGERPHFEQEFLSLLESLPWEEKPQIIQGLGPFEWPKQLGPQTVFANLSTFYMDDFGVAQAQAQERGASSFLSYWGGHRDVKGAVRFAPSSLLLTPAKSRSELQERMTFLAQRLLKEKQVTVSKQPHKSKEKFYRKNELLSARARYFFHYTPKAQVLAQVQSDELEAFALTRQGQELFSHYHHLFGGTRAQ
jgi:hypothetical protein